MSNGRRAGMAIMARQAARQTRGPVRACATFIVINFEQARLAQAQPFDRPLAWMGQGLFVALVAATLALLSWFGACSADLERGVK